MTTKEEGVLRAKLAEQAERYEEMVVHMKLVVELRGELTNEERNLLSVAYKNAVGNRRSSWRVISSIEQKNDGRTQEQRLVTEYREKIEKELKELCLEILTLLDKYLIPNAMTSQSKTFYWKMKGDYYRYLAEVTLGDERKDMLDKSLSALDTSIDIIETQFSATDPIRLGTLLSYATYYYEVLTLPNRACYLVKQAFDKAISELDTLDENSYKDTTCILQLLRDNLTLWLSESANVDDVNQTKG